MICGAREPGAGTPNYCDLKKGHAGSHRDYDGHSWPRRRRQVRTTRRNPEPITLLLLGAVAVGGAALFLLRKKPAFLPTTTGGSFAATPAFTTGLPTAEGLLVGDCIEAVNGQAGFNVDGVPIGENTSLKIVASGGITATSVLAVSNDPRVADHTTPGIVPTAAISGGGDCL